MEGLWYETFHLRRSIYRRDSVPPGLFCPVCWATMPFGTATTTRTSTCVPFIGNYEANHFEIGDAFFRAMDFLLQMGRKTAHDYYHARGGVHLAYRFSDPDPR